MTKPDPDLALERQILAGVGNSFRGTLWENCLRFQFLGGAYDTIPPEQDRHFWIESARHLEGPMRALLDPAVRIVIIIGATQVLKSIVGDAWVIYALEYLGRNMLVLFETDDKAYKYATGRGNDTIRGHPVIGPWILDAPMHSAQNMRVKIAGNTLQISGLTESNVATLTWPYVWCSEAWIHKSDGLLPKAVKRMDRAAEDCKGLFESQAGDHGEDLHALAEKGHRVPLTWECPHCHGRQTWECDSEYAKLRPDDFTGRGPNPPKPGTFAGMTFEDGEGMTIAERAATASWECFHCGVHIDDTPANRKAIMATYRQDYQLTAGNGEKYSPEIVCFYLPKEAMWNNKFSGGVANYLTAKEAQRMGNVIPLADWYKNERAVFYTPKLFQVRSRPVVSSVDVSGTVPNELFRQFMVDCQYDADLSTSTNLVLGTFWYIGWAVDEGCRNIYQLTRGFAQNIEEWIAIYRRLGISTKNVCIDSARWTHQVADAAAKYAEKGRPYQRGRKEMCDILRWSMMRGNGTRNNFPDDAGRYQIFSKPGFYPRTVHVTGSPVVVDICEYNWSNLAVKDQLAAIRRGGPGMPVMHVLPREQLNALTQDKERGPATYSQQIENEYRTLKNGRSFWAESNPNVHYKDCECMGIVNLARAGLLGHIAPEEYSTPQAA